MDGFTTELYGDDRAAVVKGGGGEARSGEEKDTNEVLAIHFPFC
jgi:hypothetical protein